MELVSRKYLQRTSLPILCKPVLLLLVTLHITKCNVKIFPVLPTDCTCTDQKQEAIISVYNFS